MASADGDVSVGEEPDYEEKMDEKPRSLLMSMIKQLKTGMDLSKVTLPTFVLEPRSFLERYSDMMLHGKILASVQAEADPLDRFLCVVKWYLSGVHFKPPGVKKPYNPIMGEVFHCKLDWGAAGRTIFVAEQVSHHPPVSAFHFVNRQGGFQLQAVIQPKSKFLGTSAGSIFDGWGNLDFWSIGEQYDFTYPSVYVRGLLIGVMRMEVAGDVTITCRKTGLQCALTFANKGFFKGENNSVSGKVTRIGDKTELAKVSGRWDRVIKVKRSGSEAVLLDVEAEKSRTYCPITIQPEGEQRYCESRRVWAGVTKGLKTSNHDMATECKSKLEDGQRAGKKERDAEVCTCACLSLCMCVHVNVLILVWVCVFAASVPKGCLSASRCRCRMGD
jgi:hypothetical protein